ERSEANAIRFPSGEYCGVWSRRVEEITRVGGWIAAAPVCPAGRSSRQMSASTNHSPYTRRPCLEMAGLLTPVPANARRSGLPGWLPRIGILHRPGLWKEPQVNRMNFPSGDHAGSLA